MADGRCERCGDAIDDGKSLCFTCASTLGDRGLDDEESDDVERRAVSFTTFWPAEPDGPPTRGSRVTVDPREVVIAVTDADGRTHATRNARAAIRDVRLTSVDSGTIVLRVPETTYTVVLVDGESTIPVLTTHDRALAKSAETWLRSALEQTAAPPTYRG